MNSAQVDWCDRRRLHLVSDEIYALSAVGDADGFLSLGELTGGDLGPRRHVLWGLSKDFGMSGLRFGVTWTQNEKLLSALATAAVFTCVPGPCQAMVAALLSDEAFVRAGKESEIPNFKGSYLGRFPLVSADFWTSDHLSERP